MSRPCAGQSPPPAIQPQKTLRGQKLESFAHRDRLPATKGSTVLTRREAIRRAGSAFGSLLVGRSAGIVEAARIAKSQGANERIQIGVIGLGARGKTLIGNLPSNAQVVAVCDCARSRIAGALQPKGHYKKLLARFLETDADRCAAYQDYRQMLDREKDLDAVIIATPDHHHVLAAALALQSGRDVYLEKPMTLTIAEGRYLVELVKKTGRVLQVGSQQRTMEMNRFACEFIRNGGLGRVTRVELPNYPGPLHDPTLPEEAVPAGLDWNLFCGPAPLRPYNRKLWVKDEFKVGDLLWRGWDLWRDFSGHMMTNWGAHTVDMVQYALGCDGTGPVTIRAIPPQSVQPFWRMWKQKTPPPRPADRRRFWPVVMHYANGVEVRFIHGPDAILFYGERGRMEMRRNWFRVDPPELVTNPPDPQVAEKWKGPGAVARPHLENWLECIRTRSTPNAPVEVGHRSITVCHLANIARELNRPLRWNAATERFVNDNEANTLLSRSRRAGFELPSG
ncbi:MAG: Gfo/Idh/MocA family oxidoreductase [Planctomycetes bacterium]|nr:Gfo/Idh/MocA family oxidoreductase [Planctomycetota bacterium]